MLIALNSLCFKSSKNKRTSKGQTAGMSNVSKSVNDDVREEEKSEQENMQIESCIVFSQFETTILLIRVLIDWRPPVASEVDVWKPYFTK